MISVTAEADQRLLEYLPENQGKRDAIRVFVNSGGCSGFSYGMGVEGAPPKPEDLVDVTRLGVSILVDAWSAKYLEGAEIDFVDQLMGGGFTIHNPNAVKTCGCGSSFQTADGAGEARACGAGR